MKYVTFNSTMLSGILLLAACTESTPLSELSANTTSPNVSSLVEAQLSQKGLPFVDDPRHNCANPKWFYEGIASATSIAELDGFFDARIARFESGDEDNGIRESAKNGRTYGSAVAVLQNREIPENMIVRAQCLTQASLSQID